MRKHLLAAASLAALASAALAAGDGPYVGIEGGATIPQSTDLDVILNNTSVTPVTTTTFGSGYNVHYKTGWNLDAIAGYKFGLFRLEAEGGYQRAPIKRVDVNSTLLGDVGTAAGLTATTSDLGLGTKMGVTYLTANALIDGDFGGRVGGYAGGGVGRAWASFSGDKDNAMAFTGIAGLRYALSPNIDAGLKYQYLHTAKLNFGDAFTVNGTNFTSSAKGNYEFPQHPRQPGLQLQRPWRSGGPGSGSPAATSTSAAGAASNADLSGRFGDPCDVGMSSAATTAPAARSDRARRTRLSDRFELPGIQACPGVL